MTASKSGSPDGFSVKHYEKDEEYDVPESLATIFVEQDKVAELVKPGKPEDPEEAARLAAEKEAVAQAKAEEAARLKAEREAERAAKAEEAARRKAEKAEQAAQNKALKAAPKNKSA